MTISGHSIANYINIFHKTEVLTVILRCLMSQYLNWIISYDINYKLFWQLCFSILEEKKASKMAIFWPLWSFFGNYMEIFHKTEIQTVILRCLVCLNPNWIKSNDIKSDNIFFSCLKMHHFRASLPKWVLTSPKEISSHIFKMAIFPKFFEAFMTHIIR